MASNPAWCKSIIDDWNMAEHSNMENLTNRESIVIDGLKPLTVAQAISYYANFTGYDWRGAFARDLWIILTGVTLLDIVTTALFALAWIYMRSIFAKIVIDPLIEQCVDLKEHHDEQLRIKICESTWKFICHLIFFVACLVSVWQSSPANCSVFRDPYRCLWKGESPRKSRLSFKTEILVDLCFSAIVSDLSVFDRIFLRT